MPTQSRKRRVPAPVLHDVDDALVRLRRLWSPGRSAALDAEGRVVEMSSLLVIEAIARHDGATQQDGPLRRDGVPQRDGLPRPARVGDVAAFCDVEASTASRLVDRAVRSGLVQRAPSPSDSRRTELTLTDAAHTIRERATTFRTGWLASVLADWSPDDVTVFAAALTRFASSVEKNPLHTDHDDPQAPAERRST